MNKPARRECFFSADLCVSALQLALLSFTAFPCTAQIQLAWVNRYSLDPSRTNQATSMALAPDGNIVVAGTSAGTNGDLDYLIIKYAPTGQQLWSTRYDSGTNGQDQLRGMALDTNGNIFVTGTTKTLKLNSSGNLLWTAPYGGRAVATDQSGNAYVTGFSELDYATVKLDPNGSNLWLRTYTYQTFSNYTDISSVIAVGANGTVAISGYETHYTSPLQVLGGRTIAYDASGSQLWTANGTNQTLYSEQPGAVAVDGSGNVVTSYTMMGLILKVLKDDPSGNMLWNSNSAAGEGLGLTLGLDAVGNIYLTSANQFITNGLSTLKLNQSGTKLWIAFYTNQITGPSQHNALTLDSAGNVYVTGFSPSVSNGNDIVTIKYDNNGNQLWVGRYDCPAHGDDIPKAIAVDNQGGVYVTGYSATTNGGTEFVTIKYSEQHVKKNNDGSIQLQFFSTPGQTSVFYGGTNFLNWSNLGTAIADTNGLVQFTDTNAPLFRYRFYKRTILP